MQEELVQCFVQLIQRLHLSSCDVFVTAHCHKYLPGCMAERLRCHRNSGEPYLHHRLNHVFHEQQSFSPDSVQRIRELPDDSMLVFFWVHLFVFVQQRVIERHGEIAQSDVANSVLSSSH